MVEKGGTREPRMEAGNKDMPKTDHLNEWLREFTEVLIGRLHRSDACSQRPGWPAQWLGLAELVQNGLLSQARPIRLIWILL
jgi:hypothetical protein